MIRRTSVGRLRREADDAIGIGPCVKPGRTVQVARLWMGWDGMVWDGIRAETGLGVRDMAGRRQLCMHSRSVYQSIPWRDNSLNSLSRASSNTVLFLHVWRVLHTKCPELPRWARMPSTAMVLVCPREHRVLHVSGSMCNCETGAK